MNRISVCIPTFNAEKYICETLESIEAQTLQPYEIVVLDDHSTDSTMEKLFEFSKHYPLPMRVVQNKQNRGIGYTRQELARLAEGDFIAYLSADDCWSSNFLEESASVVNGETATYTAYYRCDEYLRPKEVFTPPDYTRQRAIEWALSKNMFVNFSSIIIPKQVTKTSLFEPELRHGEDLIWLLDSIRAGLNWKLVSKQPLLYYRIHPQQGTHLKTHRQGEEFNLLWCALKIRLLELGVPEQQITEAYERSLKRSHPSLVHKIMAKMYHRVRGI